MKTVLKQVEALARKILKSYFCDSQLEFMISTFADDIVWLGGGEKQKAEGKEAVAACFRAGKDNMIACDMTNEIYETVEIGDGCYLCEGLSDLHSKPGALSYMNIHQRITFIFRRKGDGFETVHIHNSAPYDALKDDELFPIEAGLEQLKNLESALRTRNKEYEQQTSFLKRLYETVPCGIVQLSTEASHEVIFINPKAWEFYGYESEEEYRKDKSSKIDPVDYEKVSELLGETEHCGKSTSYIRRVVKKNGEEAFISVIMERLLNDDGRDVIQVVFTDVTEQKRLEQEQEQMQVLENKYLRTAIYEAYPLIVSINFTADTYACFTSEYMPDFIRPKGKYSEMIREDIPKVHPTYQEDYARDFDREELLKRFKSGQKEVYKELIHFGVDGNYHWLSIHYISVDNPFNDDVLAIELIKVLDSQRTEQKRQEQLLRDALASAKAANRAKSDFLSRMSHDIRTPMNAIVGMSTIGQLQADDKQIVKDCFRKIDTSSKYLLSLISDILDMSKIETDKMEICNNAFCFKDFIDDINQIIYPQAKEKGLSYIMRHAEPISRQYVGDALRIKQILMNLLSNALKFTRPNGAIDVYITQIIGDTGSTRLKFIVSDNGIGMSEEYLKRIFRPFEQEAPGNARNNVGSGLGLSIVYNIVQLMGGEISVQSVKDEGSCFSVSIPVTPVEEAVEENPTPLNGVSVLVVGESPEIGARNVRTLNSIGANALYVEAAHIDKSFAAPYFDVALLDWDMLKSNAVEIAKIIKRTGNKKADYYFASYNSADITTLANKAGISKFLIKPLFKTTLYDAFTSAAPTSVVACESGLNKEKRLDGKRILLVEDNELNQEIAKTLLEMRGANVYVARNGQVAVDMFNESKIGEYDAVLMDIRMPVMDGIEATKTIRAVDRPDAATIPILAMSANAFEEDKRQAYEAQINAYLIKPLDVDALIDELNKIISSKP